MKLLKLLGITMLSVLLSNGSYASELLIKPVQSKRLLLTVHLYPTDTSAAVMQEICGVATPARGCALTYRNGQVTIHARQPEGWCDADRLKTLGHELWHAMGEKHGKQLSGEAYFPWCKDETE